MVTQTYFIDTSFLCAFFNRLDSNHSQARDLHKSIIRNQNLQFIITDYIFDEFATLLIKRATKNLAIQYCRSLLNDPLFTLFEINQDVFFEAWHLFKRTKDKLWSFTDCTSFVVIQELNIQTALSFDRHFKQFGIEVLPH